MICHCLGPDAVIVILVVLAIIAALIAAWYV